MSAIASFYLVRNEDINRLKTLAAQPVGRIARGKWHDPYHEFLVANARELEDYGWSGYVIGSEVYFYLCSRSVRLEDYCDKALTDDFSRERESVIWVFQAEAARVFAQRIETNWPDESALLAFLHSPDMTSPNGEVCPTEAVFDGLRILMSWLSKVDENHVGLLSIG